MIILHSEPYNYSNIDSYLLTISKNGKMVRSIQYNDTLGFILKDIISILRKKYPREKGYLIEVKMW